MKQMRRFVSCPRDDIDAQVRLLRVRTASSEVRGSIDAAFAVSLLWLIAPSADFLARGPYARAVSGRLGGNDSGLGRSELPIRAWRSSAHKRATNEGTRAWIAARSCSDVGTSEQSLIPTGTRQIRRRSQFEIAAQYGALIGKHGLCVTSATGDFRSYRFSRVPVQVGDVAGVVRPFGFAWRIVSVPFEGSCYEDIAVQVVGRRCCARLKTATRCGASGR